MQKYTPKCQFGITWVIKFYKNAVFKVFLLIFEKFFINLRSKTAYSVWKHSILRAPVARTNTKWWTSPKSGNHPQDGCQGWLFCINRGKYSWDKDGILKAVYAILVGDEPFWKDAKRTIENDEDLKDLLQCVIEGQYVCYTPTIE